MALLILLFVLVPNCGNADVIIYDGSIGNNRVAWQASLTTFDNEDFTDAALLPGISFLSDNGAITGGLWDDLVTDAGASTTWTFAKGLKAWGADFDLAGPGGAGTGITVSVTYVDSTTETLGDIPTTHGAALSFWGFTSDTAVRSVTLVTANSVATQERYTLDNMSFAVPEPSSSILLLLGGAFVCYRHRRKR